MRTWILPLLLGLAAAGCDAPSQPQVDPLVEDSNRCAATGFTPGTPEMAACMQTASEARQAEANRQAKADAQEARRQQQAAEQQAADDAADQAAWDQRTQQSRDEAAALMSGSSTSLMDTPDPDPGNRPTAAGIPGMQCDGDGADASCDALSSY